MVEGGECGVLLGGKSAVYKVEGSCPACCVEFSQTWSFTDTGFIDGGQNGAFRTYDDPVDVPASPWTILNGGLGLRLDWEDDKSYRNHNSYRHGAIGHLFEVEDESQQWLRLHVMVREAPKR